METLCVDFNNSLRYIDKSFKYVKQRISLLNCIDEKDERVSKAEQMVRQVNELLKEIHEISEELVENEKTQLAREYEYYFGYKHKNPFRNKH